MMNSFILRPRMVKISKAKGINAAQKMYNTNRTINNNRETLQVQTIVSFAAGSLIHLVANMLGIFSFPLYLEHLYMYLF